MTEVDIIIKNKTTTVVTIRKQTEIDLIIIGMNNIISETNTWNDEDTWNDSENWTD